MSKYKPVSAGLPQESMPVLVKATKKGYNFGHPEVLAGHFVKNYYDTPINEFMLTDVRGWKVLEWKELLESSE